MAFQLPRVEIDHLLIKLDEPINVGKVFGEGCYGKVHQVKFNGALCIAKMLHDILKGIPQPANAPLPENEMVVRFHQECLVLSRMKHPNIVQFIGLYQPSDNFTDIALVMEQLHVDLKHFIEEHKSVLTAPTIQSKNKELLTDFNDFYLPIKLSIAHDVICGLSHIHSHKILHRDLNAGNVLLTRDLRAKVADLGVARNVTHNTSSGGLTQCPGAPDCMPPEALLDNPIYETPLDVFSLGHLVLYLISCHYPIPRDPIRTSSTTQDERVSIPLGYQAQKRIASLNLIGNDHCTLVSIIRCLSDSPKERPLLSELEKEYDELCSKHPKTSDMIYLLENDKSATLDEEITKLKAEKAKLIDERIKERTLASTRDKELSELKEEFSLLKEKYNKISQELEASEAKFDKFINLIKSKAGETDGACGGIDVPKPKQEIEPAKPLTDPERTYYEETISGLHETIRGLRDHMEITKMENQELIVERRRDRRSYSDAVKPTHEKKTGLAGKVNFVKKRMMAKRQTSDTSKEDMEEDEKSGKPADKHKDTDKNEQK